ncbi:hypothetical protein [Wolbachia endosymbiont (group B) of Germaria angustata]|uniref:hypothetical protein n=1 Tax=Wolbachia endosymbiont (group B) of Germaria angustata TaxID=3077916 RepID=UPI003132F0CC
MGKFEAIKSKYTDKGFWSAAKEVPVQGWDLVKEHKGKTIGISLAVIAVASLTAAYLLSPAYATFVGKVGTKAATLVSPAITAMSAFAVAHPLIASLVVLAAVAALITAPVLAYKNSSKSEEIKDFSKGIEEIEEIKEIVYKDKDSQQPSTKIDSLKALPYLAQDLSV